MIRQGILTLLTLFLLLASSADLLAAATDVKLYIVTDYRYLPGKTKGDPVMGQSLCGTRCNALSTNYLNIVEPGGWRLIKIADGRVLTVPLNNPFMGGDCVCVVDEYVVKADHLNKP
ncbi:MAG: hypothetical protein OEL57_09585 [Trichlorobacter sp.]|uniref:hypothetical protein n=1 Tax=Trichlorobacter sp. TaxID=2911007 RepID=UPI00256C294A|nr:hypothetical protein [Trichlorobacter sp.]MDK9718142.1 hypothetical protein [Trichlorobacter sp.]